jgi:hypothetical protein
MVSTSSTYNVIESYFANVKEYELWVNRSFLLSEFGIEYTVLEDGNITLEATAKTNSFVYFKKLSPGEDENPITLLTGNTSANTYTADFKVGDKIYILGSGSIPINRKPLAAVNIFYNNRDTELNIQQILPSVTCLDYLKTYLNMFGLYPYYNQFNNTVYLLTLEEFIKKDTFNINGISNKKTTDYNTIKSLKYTYDPKDPLISENQYDYFNPVKRGTDIQLLFSPVSTRTFICSNFSGSVYVDSNVNLISIASQDQIDLNRLSFSKADTLEYFDYSDTSAYTQNDKVFYNGNYYIAITSVSAETPTQTNKWIRSFIGQYNTTVDYDYTTKLFNTKLVNTGFTGNYITSDKKEKLFFLDGEFPEELDLSFIFENYYKRYRTMINNRTSILEGFCYIPRYKFNQYLNRPIELNYNSDVYIILSVLNYNPSTEIGSVKLIKKVAYQDYN